MDLDEVDLALRPARWSYNDAEAFGTKLWRRMNERAAERGQRIIDNWGEGLVLVEAQPGPDGWIMVEPTVDPAAKLN